MNRKNNEVEGMGRGKTPDNKLGSVRGKKRQTRSFRGRDRTGSICGEILVQRDSGKKRWWAKAEIILNTENLILVTNRYRQGKDKPRQERVRKGSKRGKLGLWKQLTRTVRRTGRQQGTRSRKQNWDKKLQKQRSRLKKTRYKIQRWVNVRY